MKHLALFVCILLILSLVTSTPAALSETGTGPGSSILEGVWADDDYFTLDFQTPGVVHLVEHGYREQDVVLPYEAPEGQLILYYNDHTETVQCTIDEGVDMMLMWPNGRIVLLKRTDPGAADAPKADAIWKAASLPSFPYQDAEESYQVQRLSPLPKDYLSDLMMVEDESGTLHAVFFNQGGGIGWQQLQDGVWSKPEEILEKADIIWINQFFLMLSPKGEPAVVCSLGSLDHSYYVLLRYSAGKWTQEEQPVLTLAKDQIAGNFLWAGYSRGKLVLATDIVGRTNGNILCINGEPLPVNPGTAYAQAGSSQDLEMIVFSLDNQGILYLDSLVPGVAEDDMNVNTQRTQTYICMTSCSEDGGRTWQEPKLIASPLGAPMKRGSAALKQGRMVMIYDDWADSLNRGKLWLARVDKGTVSDVANYLDSSKMAGSSFMAPAFREIGAGADGTPHFLADGAGVDDNLSVNHITLLADGTWRVARTNIPYYKADHMLVLHDGRAVFYGKEWMENGDAYYLCYYPQSPL